MGFSWSSFPQWSPHRFRFPRCPHVLKPGRDNLGGHTTGYHTFGAEHNVGFTFCGRAPHESFALPRFLSIAFKEALRHRMHSSISLIHLSCGIALSRVSFLINFRHLFPTLVTLAVFGLTRLLVSRYTAFRLQERQRSHYIVQLGYPVDTDFCHLDC